MSNWTFGKSISPQNFTYKNIITYTYKNIIFPFFTHIFRKSIRYIVDQRCETTFKASERSTSIPFLLRPRRAIEVALQPAMVIESPSGLANHRTSIAIRRYPKRFVCAIASGASAATCCFCSMRGRKPAIIIMANTPALSRFPPFLFISSLRAASSLPLFARLFHVHSIFLDFRPSRHSYSSRYYFFGPPRFAALCVDKGRANASKNLP